MEVELLVQINHPVAIRADAVADLLDRLNNLANARSRVEHRPPAPAGRCKTRTRRCRAPPASAGGATRARKNSPVDAVDAIARAHCCSGTFLQAHRRRFCWWHQPLRQTRGRIELDMLSRFATEPLIQRNVQRLPLDVPQSEIDRAKRVQTFLARRVEPVHEDRLPDQLGIEGVFADDASRHIADGVRRSSLSDTRDAGIGVDENDHVALRERLRPVGIVIGRAKHSNPGNDGRRQPGLRAREW